MAHPSDSRKRPRRPHRERDNSPEAVKERIEKEFAREMEMRIAYFLDSEENELELEPMNSYRRRMVHTLAKQYNLESDSRGEDRDRYVVLIKTKETPEASTPVKVRLWDYGNQVFTINPGEKGLRMALKVDGSVEIWRESEKAHIITDRVVTAREFRIRNGKILMPDDPGY